VRNRRRGGNRITGDHDGAHTQRSQLGKQTRGVGTRRIAECDQPGDHHCFRPPGSDGESAISRLGKSLQFCDARRCHRRDSGYRRRRTFDHTDRITLAVDYRGLGHLGRRIERREPQDPQRPPQSVLALGRDRPDD
jgi:hypothetical protein